MNSVENIEKIYENFWIFEMVEKFEKDFSQKHWFWILTLKKVFENSDLETQKWFIINLIKFVSEYGYSYHTTSLKDFQNWEVNCYTGNILWSFLLKILGINFCVCYIESHIFLIWKLQDWKLYFLDFSPPGGFLLFKQLTHNHFWKNTDHNKIIKLSSQLTWTLHTYLINSKWKTTETDIYAQDGIIRFLFLNEYHYSHDFEEKIGYLENILIFFPQDFEILNLLWYEYSKQKNFLKAIEYFSKIPWNEHDNFFNLGFVYMKLEDKKNAKKFFQKYLLAGKDKKLLEKAKKYLQEI